MFCRLNKSGAAGLAGHGRGAWATSFLGLVGSVVASLFRCARRRATALRPLKKVYATFFFFSLFFSIFVILQTPAQVWLRLFVLFSFLGPN
jgi:hypothetical protein